MNAADKISLYEGMLRRIVRKVKEANADADADAWLVLEDIQIACEDVLNHGVAAMQEP